MVAAVFVGQQGNGGAAVKAGNHASQKATGGGGGSASVDQSPLGATIPEQGFGSSSSDDGNLLRFGPGNSFDSDFVDTGTAKPDSDMVSVFRRGELNATPVFVRSTGFDRTLSEETYKAVDPVSARIMASAKAAGSRVNVIQVPESGSQDRLVASLQKANGKPVFSRVGRRGQGAGASLDAGGIIRLGASDVKGGKVTINQRQIDSAARSIRNGSGRSWVPIAVRENNNGTYQAVGAHANSLAIARRANSKVWAYVVGGE